MTSLQGTPARWERLRSRVAGFVAGCAIALQPAESRRFWAVLLFVRALETCCRLVAHKHPWLSVPNLDFWVMVLSSGQSVWGHVFYPEFHDSAYNSFLTRFSQTHACRPRAMKQVCQGLPLDLADINSSRAAFDEAPLTDPYCYDKPQFLASDSLVVGTQSVAAFAAQFW